jgi:hypothetical protein
MDAVRELSRMAQFIVLEDIQTLVYDPEHSAPMSAECALARAFLAWPKTAGTIATRFKIG